MVFADLIGSTSLHERLDPESVRRVMDRYYDALGTAVEEYGGTVVKLLGDGVLAAQALPLNATAGVDRVVMLKGRTYLNGWVGYGAGFMTLIIHGWP